MAPTQRIYRVREGRVLHWPEKFARELGNAVWVHSLGVIDLTDPELWSFVEGQVYKLDLAPDATPTWTEDQMPTHVRRHMETIRHRQKLAAQAQAQATPPPFPEDGTVITESEQDAFNRSTSQSAQSSQSQIRSRRERRERGTQRAADVAAALDEIEGRSE